MNVSVNLYKPIRTFKIKGGNKMKRKLALLIAAVMTVAMVPATAFASTKLTAVDEIKVGTDKIFTSRVELSKDDKQVDIVGDKDGNFDVYVTLTNGTFAYVDDDDDNAYEMDSVMNGEDEDSYNHDKKYNPENKDTLGIVDVDVISDTKAKVTLKAENGDIIKLDVADAYLYEKDINVGDRVYIDKAAENVITKC